MNAVNVNVRQLRASAYILYAKLHTVWLHCLPLFPFLFCYLQKETPKDQQTWEESSEEHEQRRAAAKIQNKTIGCIRHPFGAPTDTRLYNRTDLYSSSKMGHYTRHSCLLALVLCLVFNTQVSPPLPHTTSLFWEESVDVNFKSHL